MLNKKFFVEHASEFVQRHIKEIIRPYPLAETLQEHLQLHTRLDAVQEASSFRRRREVDFIVVMRSVAIIIVIVYPVIIP